MSRIGKKPIEIPSGVDISISDDNLVKVKGPKGELSQQVDPSMKVSIEDGCLHVERPSEQKKFKALHGLYRSLVNNMVIGVTEGYATELELIGVGFRAAVTNNNVLELNLGYSHNVFFAVPPELKVSAEMVKGKSPKVKIEGIDKQLVGHVTAEIKKLRKVEPYKGKGIRVKGEYVRKKAGKSASK